MAKGTTYAALTTVSGLAGYWIVLIGEPGQTRASVDEQAARKISGAQYDKAKDMFTDTCLKNLIVMPLSSAMRKFASEVEAYYDDLLDEEIGDEQ